MDPILSSFLGIFQIIIQAVAAYYSYKIFSFNRLNKGWLFLTFGLILMTFRRITASLIELKLLSSFSGWLVDLDRIILPTIISLSILIGLLFMLKNFESFDIIEKKVKNTIKKAKGENKR
jgi:hypothetical protein